jgi:hypothetical protein
MPVLGLRSIIGRNALAAEENQGDGVGIGIGQAGCETREVGTTARKQHLRRLGQSRFCKSCIASPCDLLRLNKITTQLLPRLLKALYLMGRMGARKVKTLHASIFKCAQNAR